MLNAYKVIHFVGIGGIGMSGIAEVLHNLRYEVTGSDIKESETTQRLAKLGIKIHIGHHESNINDAHVVVISSAVSPSNPEVVAARLRLTPVIPRAEMLAELARLKYGILVAGAHGKTTTTSLVATVVSEGGFDPTVVIGGKLKSMGTNAKLGQGDYLVAEADESDGSFLKLNPTIAVITNIDREHLDYFKEMGALKKAFLEFMNKVPFYGVAVVCIENDHVRELLPLITRKVITYGLTKEADMYASDIEYNGVKTSFNVFRGCDLVGRFTVTVPGRHNVLNSLAAIAVGLELKLSVPCITAALEGFSGIHRRFEFKGEVKGIKVYDDYGHHPSEIRATLRAARECFNGNRICVLFQPHRYTRTRDLMNDFAESFGDADSIFVMDIYAAGEKPIEGINSEVLSEMMAARGVKEVVHFSERAEMINRLSSILRDGDLLLTLGAGDVFRAGEEILARL
ncbi:MAG: UDP-N-acetylmuramate--L-alanine ligase [Dissulfurispiraceae bacterium]|jgi:UDP-N-acetylmuramate--alanine ligase|nr:UDP-N-acetylmuramate--L-alanine ligase [Dissulfurispiraceae bacterium]